ncbi:unnamed protein product [Caenorhabditis bovis]|uniref:Protein SPT2 homolog n=1 Tax=Caenorhabditis bovis TaxID=2654633 RepID=A0A8S1F246_9PELO|nr:unnamed protein product [Caenorhabditis bovis]
MDFNSVLEAANRNAKKANKEMTKIANEVKEEKNEVKRQLEAERRVRLEMQRKRAEREQEIQRKKEEERRKNFTIPKKNEKDNSGLTDALKKYYQNQEAEKREKARAAEAERDQLMQLRMKANGGKATKIGKHFGLDPIELQMRFGGNNEHIETLQKRKMREEDETDMEADKLRSGVYRAIQMKKKSEAQLRNTVKGPHRVATSKSNSLAGLCGRHKESRDNFSPPRDGKKPNEPEKREPEKKKIIPAAPVDFKSLMAAASNIAQGKSVKLDQFELKPAKSVQPPSSSRVSSKPSTSSLVKPKPPPPVRPREPERSKIVKEFKKPVEKERKPVSNGSSSSSKPPQPPQPTKKVRTEIITSFESVDIDNNCSKDSNEKVENGKKKDIKGRFQKGPTPPPEIPAFVPGKKYLPGDIRYKQAMAFAKQQQALNGSQAGSSNGTASTSSPGSSSSRDQRIANVREAERRREMDREMQRKLKRERQQREDREMERAAKMRKMEKSRSSQMDRRSYESRREHELREQQLREKYKKSKRDYGGGSFFRGGDDNSDEDEDEFDDEDDYASDLDDFIDDTEVDMDGLSRKELEETLKMVNRKYDKKLWSRRDKEISERDMISNYRQIQSEENYSKRAGLLEDLKEASKGRSVKL